MGYFRPVSDFNIAKKQEFYDRKWYILNPHMTTHFGDEQ
jgi:hypothetical protein